MNKHLLTSLCVMACGLQVVNAQQIPIAGKITDQNGTPLSGVTISIKGTNVAVTSNANGLFSLNADQNATLLISSVGYVSQEINVAGRKTINVSLISSDKELDEVIVVAYGTAKKSTFTGSASTVLADEIKDVPTTSFEDALRGKVAGMSVTSTSGQAGSTSSIRIRGIGSMNASNEPLYVIDGVPVVSGQVSQMSGYTYNTNNVMSTLNPNDIESITVLKDAAASSLYGSRAANGVVIITTKKGKTGAAKINFKSSLALSPTWATDNYKPASVQEQVNILYSLLYDSRIAAGRTPEQANEQTLMRLNSRNWTPGASYGTPVTSYGFGIHGYEFSTNGTSMFENVIIKGKTDGVENRDGKYFDWNDVLFRTGKYNVNDLSISGATETTNYFSSLGYTSDKGRSVLNDYDRFNGRVNLTQKIGSLLEFGANVSLAKTDLSGVNDTRNTSTNYLYQASNLLWPLYWPTDYKTGNTWTTRYTSFAQNVPYYNNEWENLSGTRRISATPSLLLKVLPELSVKTIFSFDETNSKDHLYYSANHYTGQSDKGIVHDMVTNFQKLVSSTTANYNKTFNGQHNFGLLVGFEAEKNNTDFVRATGRDLPNSTLHTVATAGKLESQAYSWGNTIMSALSRAEYNFDEKYFLSASYRRDGSSKLGPDVRWGNFWSVGGAWNLAKENFISNIPEINALRLRASYGINGTLPSDNNAWRPLITYGSKYMENAGGSLANSPNPNLTWETNYNTTVALEFGLFSNKLFGTLEYFNRDSKDLIQNVPQSTVTGFSSTVQNIGEINNKGVEISLGSDIIKSQDWNWTININAASTNSKVVKLNSPEPIVWSDPTGGDGRATYIYQEGESYLSFYGLEWAGTDQTNGKNVWYVNDENNPDGDFLFNGKGATYTYTKANRVIIGSGIPKFYGGINSTLDYKNLSLGLNFNYKIGGKLYDSANKDVADDGYYWERIHSQIFADETWTPDNPTRPLPMVSGRDLEDVNQRSSRHLYDASFLRLKNISLAYNIPTSLLKSAKVSNARIYFNGTNLLTFSKFKNADPEVNQYSTRGWETPLSKIYTFGIDFSF